MSIRLDAHLPLCVKCKRTFENGDQPEVTHCPECAPQQGTTHTSDTWQYTRKGVGFRLIAGFNIMRGKSG